jgi:hypothetical protein
VAALDRGEMCAVLRDFEAGIISLGGDEAAVARVFGYRFLHLPRVVINPMRLHQSLIHGLHACAGPTSTSSFFLNVLVL